MLFKIKYNNENSFISIWLIDLLSLKYFCVDFKDFSFFVKKFFLLLFKCGVKEETLSKKYSKTYFCINLSPIVFAIDLNFFSKIASDDGLLSVCLL